MSNRFSYAPWGICLALLIGQTGVSLPNEPFSPRPSPEKSRPATIVLTVSAAANLSEVLPLLAREWQAVGGYPANFNFGASGPLAQQIAQGAKVDLFAAADRASIESLDQKGRLIPGSKRVYGLGRLVIWQKAKAIPQVTRLQDLTRPQIRRIAIANPEHAPYGVAARQALQSLNLWQTLQPKLILGDNVRQAKQYAATGNVDVALIPLALGLNQPGHFTLVPDNLHQPIEQMLAVPRRTEYPEQALAFAKFIGGPQGRRLLQKYGFSFPKE